MAQRDKRKKSEPAAMIAAVEGVRKKEMGFLQASKLFSVPQSTLENYVNHKAKDVHDILNTKLGRNTVFRQKLKKNWQLSWKKYFSGHALMIRQLAFQMAARSDLQHPFITEKGNTEKKWLRGS
jgi:hypothetical protein